MVLHSGLHLVEDGNACTLHLFKQLEVATGVEGCVNAYTLASGGGSLTDGVQTAHHLGALGTVGGPVGPAATQRQEGHGGAPHPVHRVEAVGHEFQIVITLGEVLPIEGAHRHRTDSHAQRVGHMAETGSLGIVAQFVVEGGALAQTAHVQFHTVGTELAGKGKLPQLLPLEYHPVAHAHMVARGLLSTSHGRHQGGQQGHH